MRNILLGIAASVVILSSCASEKSIQTVISSTMHRQQESWNKGDLPGFMHGYWESDSLRFMGKDGVTYGWKATLQRYQNSYPTPEKMGQLTFSQLRIEKINSSNAYVDGIWTLAYPNDKKVSGHFTLLWKKINGTWVIVSDHSS